MDVIIEQYIGTKPTYIDVCRSIHNFLLLSRHSQQPRCPRPHRALAAGDLNPHLPGATSRGTFCTVLAGASPVGIESGEDNLYLPTPYILELVLRMSG